MKVLIEDDSKIFGSSSIWFSTPKTVRKVLIDRHHAGSSKARSAQVLRNSPRAMPLSGYELVRSEMVRCRIDSVMTGDAVRRKCSPVFPLTIDV